MAARNSLTSGAATLTESSRKKNRSVKCAAGARDLPAYTDTLAATRAFIDNHGGRHVEIWQGESGFPSWFPKNHWLFPRGVCKEGWQSQANQAKWMLRRFVTDRRAGITLSSFYQTADISRRYSMATTTKAHPAEHGVLNGWTYEPKMVYHAFGHYNALVARAKYDAATPAALAPEEDDETRTLAAAFRTEGAARPFFVYYTPFDFSGSYTGKVYTARTDAALTVATVDAPAAAVLVDLLRGGVYAVQKRTEQNGRTTFPGLPLTDYPLVLADRREVPLLSAAR